MGSRIHNSVDMRVQTRGWDGVLNNEGGVHNNEGVKVQSKVVVMGSWVVGVQAVLL